LPRCGHYVGVEYDHAACLVAREKTGGQANILEADARNLPLEAGQFSLIICLEVLEHLGDYAAGVRNIHRCITPDGTAVISVSYRCISGRSEINPYHVYEPGEGELVSLFREFFETVEVYYQYF
jgi:SAM-dependent methyltransferase